MAGVASFDPVGVELFKACSDALHCDEFLSTSQFDVFKVQGAGHFGARKIDAHFIATGHNTLSECIAALPRSPNDSFSVDEIIGICERFVDLQVARLNGHPAITTVLTSIYMQKSFEIESPILKFMFQIFSGVCYQLERFVNSISPKAQDQCYWTFCREIDQNFTVFDSGQIRAELSEISIPEELRRLAEFEIAFSEYLENPRVVAIPDATSAFAPVWNDIGIDRLIRYRNGSPTGAPPYVPIPPHAEAVVLFQGLISDLAENRSLCSEIMDVATLFERIITWNDSKPHLSFSRLVLTFLICNTFDNVIPFGELATDKYVHREFSAIYLHPKFFSCELFSTFVEVFQAVFGQIVERLVSPIPVAQRFLSDEGSKTWATLQKQGYSIFVTYVPDGELPRCRSKEHKSAAAMIYAFWGTQIAAQLLFQIYRWGDAISLYSVRDLPILMYCLDSIAQTASVSYRQFRLAKAVYNVRTSRSKNTVWTRTEEEVMQQLKREPQIPEEYLWLGIAHVLTGVLQMYRLFRLWHNFDVAPGQFFNEKQVFDERVKPVALMAHFKPLEYDNFVKVMTLEDTPAGIGMALAEAGRKFTTARTTLGEYVKFGGAKGNALFRGAFGAAVSNAAILGKLSSDKRFTVDLQRGFIFPCFKLCE
jgi:hypothetical protein